MGDSDRQIYDETGGAVIKPTKYQLSPLSIILQPEGNLQAFSIKIYNFMMISYECLYLKFLRLVQALLLRDTQGQPNNLRCIICIRCIRCIRTILTR